MIKMKRYTRFLTLLILPLSGFVEYSHSFPKENINTKVQSHAIWNLQFSLKNAHDDQIISLLSKIQEMPENLWNKILILSLDTEHTKLRKYILKRFSEDFPYYDQNRQIYIDFVAMCDTEYKDFIQKDLPQDEDADRIIMVLRNIKKWKLKELFYQTSSLIAYPIYEVRKEANEALTKIMDDRIFPIVLNLSQSNNPVEKTYAIDSLYYFRDERMVPVLLQMLNDKNKSVRYYAIRSLEVLDSQEALPYYIRILKSDINDEVRILTANVLAKSKPPFAFNALLDSLPDPNPNVRRAVLNALNEYRYVAAANGISRQLYYETENDLKIMEINSLLLLNNSGMMTGLNHILKNESDTTVRLWAVYATGRLLDYNGYEILLENISHKNPAIREETALALGGFKVRKSVNLLIGLLKNKEEPYKVQAAALYALRSLDDNTALPDLYDLSTSHENIVIKAEIKEILKDMIGRRFK